MGRRSLWPDRAFGNAGAFLRKEPRVSGHCDGRAREMSALVGDAAFGSPFPGAGAVSAPQARSLPFLAEGDSIDLVVRSSCLIM